MNDCAAVERLIPLELITCRENHAANAVIFLCKFIGGGDTWETNAVAMTEFVNK